MDRLFSSLDAMKAEVEVRAGTLGDGVNAENALKHRIDEMDASIKLLKKQTELTDEQKQEVRAYGCTPPSIARPGWFKTARSCGEVRTCSPTFGRGKWVPNQLRSGVASTNHGAVCGEVSADHKTPTGLPK